MRTRAGNLRVIAVLLLAAAMSGGLSVHAAGDCHWSYEGSTGPASWWKICSPKFCVCTGGVRQSPIDLAGMTRAELPPLGFRYRRTPLAVLNNGHTIEVPAGGSELRAEGQDYELIQFHFHTPSEHLFEGKEAPMELHFVHANALGELAVVGVMLREGAANPTLQKIWDIMPKTEGTAFDAKVRINPAALLPAGHAYARYAGSLTTPSCSEGVRWFVLLDPVEASAEQIAAFRKIFPNNARPVQPRNGREILVGRDQPPR
jgi:carbonic anhydrase